MTKQKEINEAIAVMLHRMQTNPFREPAWLELPEWRKDQYRKNAYFMMVMLDDRDVVIKMEGELPKFFCNYGHLAKVRSRDGCIVVVESLV